MNSCILMAEVVQEPQLRYTQGDNQVAVSEMLVQFSGPRVEDPPYTLKVVGWGNLAQEINERCRQGAQVVIEGRLSMNTLDRPEGFKEKRAELTAQKIHYLGTTTNFQSATPVATTAARNTSPATVSADSYGSSMATTNVVPMTTTSKVATMYPVDDEPTPKLTTTPLTNQPTPTNQPDVDDIPF